MAKYSLECYKNSAVVDFILLLEQEIVAFYGLESPFFPVKLVREIEGIIIGKLEKIKGFVLSLPHASINSINIYQSITFKLQRFPPSASNKRLPSMLTKMI